VRLDNELLLVTSRFVLFDAATAPVNIFEILCLLVIPLIWLLIGMGTGRGRNYGIPKTKLYWAAYVIDWAPALFPMIIWFGSYELSLEDSFTEALYNFALSIPPP